MNGGKGEPSKTGVHSTLFIVPPNSAALVRGTGGICLPQGSRIPDISDEKAFSSIPGIPIITLGLAARGKNEEWGSFLESGIVIILIVSGNNAGQAEDQSQAERGKSGSDEEDGLIITDTQSMKFPMYCKESAAQQQAACNSSGSQSELEVSLTECSRHGCITGSGKGKHLTGCPGIKKRPYKVAKEQQHR